MNLDKQIQLLLDNQLIPEEHVYALCARVKHLLTFEPNVLKVYSPITICGDLHGQFNDLKKLFKLGGFCPTTNYLFLGDFIDRGYNSVETLLLLFSLKARFPDRINLIRGNHESRQITQVYGFYDECLRKYQTANVWRVCCAVFDCLSLACVVDNQIFCVHGGLSPLIQTIDQIGYTDRIKEIPYNGPMCDLLWSDPDNIKEEFAFSPRGAGYLFGSVVTKDFLYANNLLQIARSHQLVMEGYKHMFDEKLVTVWSAPNYCYRCGNVASFMKVQENIPSEFVVFEAANSTSSFDLHHSAFNNNLVDLPTQNSNVMEYFM